MIVITSLLRTADGQKPGTLERALRHNAVEIVQQAPEVLAGTANLVTDKAQRGVTLPRSTVDADAFLQLWFADLNAANAFAAGERGRALRRLLDTVSPGGEELLILQNRVIEPGDKARLKRMSTLGRKPGVSFNTFQREWFGLHEPLVRRVPQMTGYVQNLVLNISGPARSEPLPVQGIVELWFEDLDTLAAGYDQPIARTLMAHGMEFISEITTFLVEPVAIK